MGMRFRKSFGKGPFKVTVSKSGVGYSAGVKGFRVTKKAGGGMRTTASIPGTGISYVKDYGTKKSSGNSIGQSAAPSGSVRRPFNFKKKKVPGYCIHCNHRIGIAAICPACGKPQQEGAMQRPVKIKLEPHQGNVEAKHRQGNVAARRFRDKVIDILLGVFTWLGTTIAIGLAGEVLGLPDSKGILKMLYTLAFACIPVLLAFKIAAPEKLKINQPARQLEARPAEKPVSPEMKTGAAEIVKALHEETLRHAYGEDFVDPLQEDGDTTPAVSEPDTSTIVAKTHKVTGMQHYLDNILSLTYENPDYDMSKKEIIDCDMVEEKIWKYSFAAKKAELVPEPDNPYDSNAIKVLIDGTHVGYIKSGSCAHLLKVIDENRIQDISFTIGGGPYKEVIEEFDDDTGDNVYTMEHGEANYAVKLTVYEEK